MKSVRLTKELRQRILTSYLECYAASNPAPKHYEESEIASEFLEKIRQNLFKKAGVDESSIPANFLNTSCSIRLVMPDGTYVSLYFKDEKGYSEYRPVPQLDGVIKIEQNDPDYLVYKEAKRNIKELNKAHSEWQDKQKSVRYQVSTALDAVNTTGQLLTAWPEAEKFIPSDVLDFSKIQVPSVSFESLNKAVGI